MQHPEMLKKDLIHANPATNLALLNSLQGYEMTIFFVYWQYF